MIAYLSTAAHAYTLQWLIQPDGWAPELRDTIVAYSYEQLLQPIPQPLFSAYIFTDLERLNLPTRQRLAQIWDQLAALEPAPRLLNHPLKAKRRLDLLNSLYQAGINTFNAYPVPAQGIPEPRQFPVFVRQADDHNGPLSELLNTPAELAAEINKLRAFGEWGPETIVTEFLDSRTANGYYQKYGTVRVGPAFIPQHIHESDHWMVKRRKTALNQTLVDQELAFMYSHADQAALKTIFELAEIDFGRIDYTWAQGQIQVFEINTNPTTLYPKDAASDLRDPCRALFKDRLVEALRHLDAPGEKHP